MVKNDTDHGKPLLSICIPTYNRAYILKESLDSLVSQNRFSEIEVVISDNCSTDCTQEVVAEYVKKYPNIRYFRNGKNIEDRNFPTVLMKAKGVYRKLVNDSLCYETGALDFLRECVQKNIDNRPFLYFDNGNIRNSDRDFFIAESLAAYMDYVSYFITWIGGFGLWEEDCINLQDEFKYCDTHLWQVYKTCKLISGGRQAIVFSKKILWHAKSLSIYETSKDLSYGVFRVFYVNYFDILKQYVDNAFISATLNKKLKKDVLFGLFLDLFINIPIKNHSIGNETNYKQLVHAVYKKEPYYLRFCIEYRLRYFLEKNKRNRIEFFSNLKSFAKTFPALKLLLAIKRRLHIKLY